MTAIAPGTLTITKRTTAATTRTFAFTFGAETFVLGRDATKTITGVTPGTYTVTEDATSGWLLATLACTDPTGDSVVTLAEHSASVVIAPGETVTCTFTNRLTGSGILPSTGSSGLSTLLAAGAGFILFGGVLRAGRRRRSAS